MYIEQLTNIEIKNIFKMIISTVNNEQEVEFRLSHMKIEKWDNAIRCVFPTGYENHLCVLEDFDAFLSYGDYETPVKITKLYRRYMYQKFGEEYKTDLDKFYREPIVEKYMKEIARLDSEINDMTC